MASNIDIDPASIAEALRRNVESYTPSVDREEVGRRATFPLPGVEGHYLHEATGADRAPGVRIELGVLGEQDFAGDVGHPLYAHQHVCHVRYPRIRSLSGSNSGVASAAATVAGYSSSM